MAVDEPRGGREGNANAAPRPAAPNADTEEMARRGAEREAAGGGDRGGPGDPRVSLPGGAAPVQMASDQPPNLPPALVPAGTATLTAPIVVPNTFWRAEDPLAYEGGRPSELTHLHEYGETEAGRHDDGRWGQLDLIPTKADYILDLIRANSLWPLTSGLACCAIEMMSAATSRNDMDRWGMFPFRASPRQADVLIAAGTLTTKMAGPFLRLWEQMPEPKWCVAMGDCTVSGGRYKRSYSVIEGIDRIMPVDVYIPGCPPRPEGLIYGMLKLAQLVKERRGHWQERQIGPNVPSGI